MFGKVHLFTPWRCGWQLHFLACEAVNKAGSIQTRMDVIPLFLARACLKLSYNMYVILNVYINTNIYIMYIFHFNEVSNVAKVFNHCSNWCSRQIVIVVDALTFTMSIPLKGPKIPKIMTMKWFYTVPCWTLKSLNLPKLPTKFACCTSHKFACTGI